jgi:Plasmid pRiA4b ORF-3-like protein
VTEHDGSTPEEIAAGLRILDPADVSVVAEDLQPLTVPRRAKGAFEPGTVWYIIRVELTSGRAGHLEPPPGRDLLISSQHTFRQLAEAINSAFARWDLGHLYAFRLSDGAVIGIGLEDPLDKEAARTKVGKRRAGEIFDHEFDFGDSWQHRCAVLEVGVVPEDVYGVRPRGPVAVWGWGSIPDQYGRITPEG